MRTWNFASTSGRSGKKGYPAETFRLALGAENTAGKEEPVELGILLRIYLRDNFDFSPLADIAEIQFIMSAKPVFGIDPLAVDADTQQLHPIIAIEHQWTPIRVGGVAHYRQPAGNDRRRRVQLDGKIDRLDHVGRWAIIEPLNRFGLGRHSD